MRLRTLLPLLLLVAPLFASIARAQGDLPRVVVVKTILIPPFEEAAAELVRNLLQDMDVWVVPVVPGKPRESRRVLGLRPDVVVSIGSQATEWVKRSIPDVPIVFSMVLDPVSGGFVSSFGKPGGRITGAALDIPARTQFQAMKELLDARRVAVLYNPETSGDTIRVAKAAAKDLGIELFPLQVTDRRNFDATLQRVDQSFDVLWSVPDAVVLSKALSQSILLHTIRRGIPLMGFSEQHVKAGALFALGTSHAENGRQAAESVRRLVGGEKPGDIPVATPQKLEVVFNPRTAESLSIDLPRISFARVRPVR